MNSKSRKTQCKFGKIRNPETGRCVKVTGKIGKQIMKRKARKSRSRSKKAKARKRSRSSRVSYKSIHLFRPMSTIVE